MGTKNVEIMYIVHESIQYRGFLLWERYSTVEMNGS